MIYKKISLKIERNPQKALERNPQKALREDRKKLSGNNKPSKSQVALACRSLLEDIGECRRGFTKENLLASSEFDVFDVAEDLVHEMAHHVALTGSTEFHTRRPLSISKALDGLLPAQRAGNEIDALSIEANAFWWLYIPLTRKDITRILPSDFDMDMTPQFALKSVQSLRKVWPATELGKGLATAIYQEIERQKREAQAD